MKKFILPFIILLSLILSCNHDDDQILVEEKSNGFFIDSDFYKVNKAYYIQDLTTEELDDFFIVITDGEIVSPRADSNNLLFSDATTNYVIFRGIQQPDVPTAVNFAPGGSYIFNSDNESFSFAHFNFDCEFSNGALRTCEYAVNIEEPVVPNVAIIDIEIEHLTSNYLISFNIELPDSVKISGQYQGVLNRLDPE